MSGKAIANVRCHEEFQGDRCALAEGHASRHRAGVADRSITWGWADDPEYGGMEFADAIDVVDSSGRTIYSEVY